jgi:hypothetical protein
MQNDPKRLSKLKNKLEFAKSITAIDVADVKVTTDARKAEDTEIIYLETSANAKLVENYMDVSKITKKEIIMCSLLVTFYAVAEMLEKKKIGM